MQFQALIAALLATSFATAAPAHIGERQCTPTTQTITFDNGIPASITLQNYTPLPPSSADVTVAGLTAISPPNLAYSPAAVGFPPIIPGGTGITSSDDSRTFTLDSFFFGGVDVGTIQLLGWTPENILTIAFPTRGPAVGGMSFVDVAGLNNAGFSGLHTFTVIAESGNFQRAHALDNVTVTWEC